MAVRLLSAAAAAQQINLRIDIAEELADVPAEPLYPVVTNALRNSIEAIAECEDAPDEQWLIDLDARIVDEHVVLTIRDNGPGFDPSLLQGDQFRYGETTKPHGNGIGLSLARDITQAVGGTVQLNNRDGGGAQLVVRVPAQALHDSVADA